MQDPGSCDHHLVDVEVATDLDHHDGAEIEGRCAECGAALYGFLTGADMDVVDARREVTR